MKINFSSVVAAFPSGETALVADNSQEPEDKPPFRGFRSGFQRRGEAAANAPAQETRFQQEYLQNTTRISTAEFALEMLIGVPRGVRQMGRDVAAHPVIFGGTLAVVLGSTFLPGRAALWAGRIFMGIGIGTSATFIGLGTYHGVAAWRRNDLEGLREASTQFGVGLVSLGLAYGGIRLGKYLGRNPQSAMRLGLMGNLLHSPDEIAAAVALIQGISKIRAPVTGNINPYLPTELIGAETAVAPLVYD